LRRLVGIESLFQSHEFFRDTFVDRMLLVIVRIEVDLEILAAVALFIELNLSGRLFGLFSDCVDDVFDVDIFDDWDFRAVGEEAVEM
jgi:hypothetical protein